ncbi:MAG: hypothetical protein ABUR63_00925 [Verrucomicrobiota bacterium]
MLETVSCWAALLWAAALPLAPGRTTVVVVPEDTGTPVERAFPNEWYRRAAEADAGERWEEARPLYRRAAEEWTARARRQPSPALELAIAKADHEAARSEELAARARNASFAGHIPDHLRDVFRRRQAFEEGRLLRDKLMAVRAALGRLPPGLYMQTRARLREAIDPEASSPRNAEVQLWRCAAEAVGGDAAAARLARAAVPEAARADASNAVALAACAAALHEDEAALRALEGYVLRLPPPRPGDLLRELSLANDWDRLRGSRRFESLFW